jgi:cytochrome c553
VRGEKVRLTLILAVLFLTVPIARAQVAAPSSDLKVIGTMSELMIRIIYPSSDAVFYITTRTPETEVQWGELQGQTLMLAESANILMLPGHARDQEQWMADAKLMSDAGAAAFKAAKAKDVTALEAVNDQLYQSCTTCHMHYRRNYGRGATPGAGVR